MNTIKQIELYTQNGVLNAKGIINIRGTRDMDYDIVVKNNAIIQNSLQNKTISKNDIQLFEESLTNEIILDIISKL